MPQEPKKRHSRQRQGKRRASINLPLARGKKCENCGAIIRFHITCPQCGFYKGKQVLYASKVTKKAEGFTKVSEKSEEAQE